MDDYDGPTEQDILEAERMLWEQEHQDELDFEAQFMDEGKSVCTWGWKQVLAFRITTGGKTVKLW